ncbi:two-component regulator propeller domain-containing protein [Labilibaculum manganireducens]|uniref:hybrid sensor histidine kinase/response regulator transcription factor n=1 Tax=Labilibaculum manganireducens TaxID=1940525 RepID=UPI0029F48B57|nr:two-component regulator propeller domain-containing protein [Labilibaculum manganireducens]
MNKKKHMHQLRILTIIILSLLQSLCALSQDIYRFEHFNSENGLSQNTISSLLCDRKGFLWIGTMNGLNRYDGYRFKIYKSKKGDSNVFTNNRVIDLWEDYQGFIWMKTYDGYYHYLNPELELFKTIPEYVEIKSTKKSMATCFLQYSPEEIWVGTTNEGVLYLKYNSKLNNYTQSKHSDKGRYSITNKEVRFIVSGKDSSVWVGTKKGVNLLTKKDLNAGIFNFQHLFINYSFNSAIELNDEIWLGTDNHGIIKYNKNESSFRFLDMSNTSSFESNQISNLYQSKDGIILATFVNKGVLAFNPDSNKWTKLKIHGDEILNVYFDKKNNAWITATEFGITKIELSTLKSKYYELTTKNQRVITDLERHVFYEDLDSNLWIGLHGGALTYYNSEKDKFIHYQNNPSNPNSISSSIVHCIAEDLSGQMWLGTGQYKGGLEKIIKRDPAFTQILPIPEFNQITDNVVRSICQDKNGYIWFGTKAGDLHIYSPSLKKLSTIQSFHPTKNDPYKDNIYSIFIDHQNYLWLGTKGKGLLISQTPIPNNPAEYTKIKFNSYLNNPKDSTSLAGNNIYSISQDQRGNIWIGTFGNGICKTNTDHSRPLVFQSYSTSNSQLSSDLVRCIYSDSDSNLWVATSFGLNLVKANDLKQNNIIFQNFYYSAEKPNSINYNDVVEVFEDSKKQVWFGTFGGGVNKLSLPIVDTIQFSSVTSESGLSNDVIFGIKEDNSNHLWFSSENGLSRYDESNKSIQIYNESNGLAFNNFAENTCYTLADGRILFGGSNGIEVVRPGLIKPSKQTNFIELTNFQLFNKDVIVGAPKSPLKKNISYTNDITLLSSQSSFSIEYSALNLSDPKKNQYAYLLENFDTDWNYVGNQTKATYTNLAPGEYKFKVKSTTRTGFWNENERVLRITISPAWWQTKLAFFAYLLFSIGLIIFSRYIIKRMNKFRNDLTIEKTINELKLRFFTNISHEIRTPLTLILGPIEDLLQQDNLDAAPTKKLRIIRKNAKRMLQLVNQLLDFRKVQNNKMQLKIQEVDLNEFTKDIFESFIPLANHKQIFYSFQNSSTPINIWGDRSKLDSIIYNLISNAIKFTPKGKKVIVSVKINSSKNKAEVFVTDEGPGIPEKNISEIFNRYTILSNHDFAGTGIGLSLAHELAILHHGSIELSSTVGEGSVFCFSMPLDKEKLMQSPNIQAISDESQQPIYHHVEIEDDNNVTETSADNTNDQVILIVEDNEEILAYTKDSLSSLYSCIVANNGKEGLRLAQIHNPDVIITDIMMPEMDGIEMTRLLKENFTTCHIPIVMMTAKVDVQDKITGFETGAEAYITKPLQMAYLKAVLKTLITQRKLVISKYRDNKTIDPKTLKVNSKDEDFLKQLVTYIETNYATELSVDSLSGFCCVSRTVFYNKIKGLTGLSPLEFIREIKLKIAMQFLEKGFSVSEVAHKIGYTDVKYFSKQFSSQYGYPPSKLKKINKSKSEGTE